MGLFCGAGIVLPPQEVASSHCSADMLPVTLCSESNCEEMNKFNGAIQRRQVYAVTNGDMIRVLANRHRSMCGDSFGEE